MFKFTNNSLKTTFCKYSGTTISTVLVINNNSDKYAISINIGDSPILYKNKLGDISNLYKSHNCDNMEAVQDYINMMYDKQIKAYPIYFNRINCRYSSSTMVEFTNKDKIPCPIEAYQIKNGVVELNIDNYDRMTSIYHKYNIPSVGIQSRNKFLVLH